MPLTVKGKEIKSAMTSEYGDKEGERVFYASRNKGTISGVDRESKAKDMAAMSPAFPRKGKPKAKPEHLAKAMDERKY